MRALWRVVLLALFTGACDSPEASRTRGGGPGADLQNRPAIVKMHEGSDPFWKTPFALDEPEDDALLDAARHARQQSVTP